VYPLLSKASQTDLVLASRSPRRFELLSSLGFEFDVVPADEEAERGVRHDDPRGLPEIVARRKCDQVAAKRPGSIVVAADTVVIVDGEILNKPADDDEARRYLSLLSGRTHSVVTGVVIQRRRDGVDLAASETTRVTFRALADEEIDAYVATGEGRDKAGSYGVQGLGAGLVRSIEGCYYNVVGLPVALLCEMLRKIG
jgi:septum formation protein